MQSAKQFFLYVPMVRHKLCLPIVKTGKVRVLNSLCAGCAAAIEWTALLILVWSQPSMASVAKSLQLESFIDT